MTTPDELWEKYSEYSFRHGFRHSRKEQFLAALQEYGELVKAEAVKVCEEMSQLVWCDCGCEKQKPTTAHGVGAFKCAAAIKEMKLP